MKRSSTSSFGGHSGAMSDAALSFLGTVGNGLARGATFCGEKVSSFLSIRWGK